MVKAKKENRGGKKYNDNILLYLMFQLEGNLK